MVWPALQGPTCQGSCGDTSLSHFSVYFPNSTVTPSTIKPQVTPARQPPHRGRDDGRSQGGGRRQRDSHLAAEVGGAELLGKLPPGAPGASGLSRPPEPQWHRPRMPHCTRVLRRPDACGHRALPLLRPLPRREVKFLLQPLSRHQLSPIYFVSAWRSVRGRLPETSPEPLFVHQKALPGVAPNLGRFPRRT